MVSLKVNRSQLENIVELPQLHPPPVWNGTAGRVRPWSSAGPLNAVALLPAAGGCRKVHLRSVRCTGLAPPASWPNHCSEKAVGVGTWGGLDWYRVGADGWRGRWVVQAAERPCCGSGLDPVAAPGDLCVSECDGTGRVPLHPPAAAPLQTCGNQRKDSPVGGLTLSPDPLKRSSEKAERRAGRSRLRKRTERNQSEKGIC